MREDWHAQMNQQNVGPKVEHCSFDNVISTVVSSESSKGSSHESLPQQLADVVGLSHEESEVVNRTNSKLEFIFKIQVIILFLLPQLFNKKANEHHQSSDCSN